MSTAVYEKRRRETSAKRKKVAGSHLYAQKNVAKYAPGNSNFVAPTIGGMMMWKFVLAVLIVLSVIVAMYATVYMFLPAGSYGDLNRGFGMEVGKNKGYMIITAGTESDFVVIEPFGLKVFADGSPIW